MHDSNRSSMSSLMSIRPCSIWLELGVTDAPRHLDARTARMAKLRADRDQILKVTQRHGATNVRVFGSVACGQDQPDSDIDLLVDLDVGTHGLLPLAAIVDELSALLGEPVDVAPADALAPHVAASALAEAVPL